MYAGLPPSRYRRAFFALAVVMIASDMIFTAVLMVWAHHSTIMDVSMPDGARRLFTGLFSLCAAALAPFVFAQLRPAPPPRWVSTLLCGGCLVAALAWVGVAFAERNSDLAGPLLMYIMQAACAILMALIVAASNNARQRDGLGLRAALAAMDESNRITVE